LFNPLKYRFSYLLLTLILTIAVAPVVSDCSIVEVVFDLLLSLTLILGCFAIGQNRQLRIVSSLLTLPMQLSIWGSYLFNIPVLLVVIGKVFGMAFFIVVCAVPRSLYLRLYDVDLALHILIHHGGVRCCTKQQSLLPIVVLHLCHQRAHWIYFNVLNNDSE
jgi:hypothetical protein